MMPGRRHQVRLLVRVSVYIVVIIILLLARGRPGWRRLAGRLATGGAADTTLVVTGADLAPALIGRLVDNYRRDYPALGVRIRPGGTAAALEDLVNRRADAAFLSRPPLPAEQRLFAGADGDTALWFSVALGAICVLTAADAPDSTPSVDALRRLARGDTVAGGPRLYVPDPNSGLWDALRAKLGLPPGGVAAPPGVVFLRDDAAVAAAVRADARAFGVVSSFALPGGADLPGVRVAALRATPGGAPVRPVGEEIATGAYPLWHYLYVCCLPGGGVQGTKFVTQLTSPRGQRQIERTPFLPARQVPREIHLNRRPPGA